MQRAVLAGILLQTCENACRRLTEKEKVTQSVWCPTIPPEGLILPPTQELGTLNHSHKSLHSPEYVSDGERLLLEPLVRVVPTHRLLRSGDQVLVFAVRAAGHLVQLLVELLQRGHLRKSGRKEEIRRKI